MTRKKLKKFEKAKTLLNIFLKDRVEDREKLKNIIKKYPKNFLELAAGRGEYTLYLADKNPDTLCIAVDFRSDRLLWGAEKAIEKKLENAIFLRERVEDIIYYFTSHSIDKIWLPFPDPFPKKRHEKHRLTNPKYLQIYKKLLKPQGLIYFKTDSKELFEYTLQTLQSEKTKILLISKDLVKDSQKRQLDEEILLPTRYQKQAVENERKIYFLKFKPR